MNRVRSPWNPESSRRARALVAAACVAGAYAAGYATCLLLGGGPPAPEAGVTAVPEVLIEPESDPPPTPLTPLMPSTPLPPVTLPPLPALKARNGPIEIVLSNPGPTLEDYTVRFELPRADGMLPDCRGLRFTDAGRPLPFWIEAADEDGVAAWVRFPGIARGTTRITVKYGEPAAGPASDGEAAFLLFDDFAAGLDTEKWQTNRDASAGGAGAFVRDGVMHVQGGDNKAKGWLRSLVDLPDRLAVESRWKVERKNDYCKGGLRLRGQGQGKFSVGVDYNFFSYQPERALFANRDSFAIHFNDHPNPERAGVKLPGFWRDVWFRQRLAYDGASAARNVLYMRDKGEGPERLAADAPKAGAPVRIWIQPWAWYQWPTQFFQIDWIAVRNYAPARLEVRVSGPGAGDARRSVFDDLPPVEAEVPPGPVEVAPGDEDELEVF